MTSTVAPGSRALIAQVRRTRAAAVAAEVELFVLAAEWADTHPEVTVPYAGRCHAGCAPDTGDPSVGDHAGGCAGPCPDDPEGFSDPLIPSWSWSAAAPLGAALGRTTHAARLLIRDALIVRHRLPRVWARVLACQVEPWRARRIAKAVVGRPRDVSDWLDEHLAPVAHTVGLQVLDRLLDEAMLRLHPEEREQAQLDELDRRHATLHLDSINDSAIAEMTLRADWKDLSDFDRTLSQVAAALADLDRLAGLPGDTLDVRRARAVGILADPAQALALLDDANDSGDTGDLNEGDDPVGDGGTSGGPRVAGRPLRKRIQLVLHITPDHLAGRDPVARNGTLGRAELDQTVRDWCGRTDTHLTVLPVLDLAGHAATEAYEVRGRTRERVDLIAGTCVFPWCARPARRCDHDHVVPHEEGGATCECNLAPLCRHHHRLKTHAGWSYTPLETGRWLWSDPHGQQFLRDHTGTLDVTPEPGPPGGRARDGCRVPAARSPGWSR